MVAALSAAVLASCGGGEKNDRSGRGGGSDGASLSFPPAKKNPAGNWYAPVKDQAEGDRLCKAALDEWPDVYASLDQVTFDIPGTGADVTCIRG